MEEQILILHSKNMNNCDIAKELKISRHTVARILKKNNLKSNNNKPLKPRNFTEKEVCFMINLYNEGFTIEEIYETHFKERCSSKDTIRSLLSRRIQLRRRGKRIDFNEDYFETIDTERKAYWLGFIYADGNVCGNRLRIEIKEEDRYLLEELNEDLGSDNKVCHSTGKHHYNGYDILKNDAYIGYCSNKMRDDLNKLGIVENKTFKLNKLPDISVDLLRHFIRGYFDGDGTVYINNKTKRLVFGFYGQHDFLENIKQVLIEDININKNKITDKETVSLIYFSKYIDVISFYNYIYKEATIFLTRKKQIFDLYLNE